MKKDAIDESRYNKIIAKLNNFQTNKNWLYNITIFILTVFSLMVAMLYLGNVQGVEKLSNIIDVIDYGQLTVLLVSFVLIMLLMTLSDYLYVYSKTKRHKFGAIYKANSYHKLFQMFGIYNKTADLKYLEYLMDKRVKPVNAVDSLYSKKLYSRLAVVIYTFVILAFSLLGSISTIPLWILLISIVVFVYNFIAMILLFIALKDYELFVRIINKFLKTMYKIGLIKDIEKTFSNINDKYVLSMKALRQNKTLIFTSILCHVFILFLKGLVVYFTLTALNFDSGNLLIEILLKVMMIEMILQIYPLQKGTLIIEILFILLFNNVFISGYLFWGLLIYRLFDYFIYIIQGLVVKIIDNVSDNIKIRKNNKLT